MPQMTKGHFDAIAVAIGTGAAAAEQRTGIAGPIIARILQPVIEQVVGMCWASSTKSNFSQPRFEQVIRTHFRWLLPLGFNPANPSIMAVDGILYETDYNYAISYTAEPGEPLGILTIDQATIDKACQLFQAADGKVIPLEPVAEPVEVPIPGYGVWHRKSGGSTIPLPDGLKNLKVHEYKVLGSYQWFRGTLVDFNGVEREGYWKKAHKDGCWYLVSWVGQVLP